MIDTEYVNIKHKLNPLTEKGQRLTGHFWGVETAADRRRDPKGTLGLEYVKRVGVVDHADGSICFFAVTWRIKLAFTPWGDMDTGILDYKEATRGHPEHRKLEVECVESAVPAKGQGPEIEFRLASSAVQAAVERMKDAHEEK